MQHYSRPGGVLDEKFIFLQFIGLAPHAVYIFAAAALRRSSRLMLQNVNAEFVGSGCSCCLLLRKAAERTAKLHTAPRLKFLFQCCYRDKSWCVAATSMKRRRRYAERPLLAIEITLRLYFCDFEVAFRVRFPSYLLVNYTIKQSHVHS